MKRLLFPALVIPALAGAMVAIAACDPDLSLKKVPGEAGPEAAVTDSAVPPPQDGGAEAEAGSSEGGTEAGVEHLIDGTNDFTAGEKFTTSSANYDGYITWDDRKVYFGMSGADVSSGSNQKWVLIYVDGVPGNAGTPDGIAYDCSMNCLPGQQAHLPFNAGFHIQWQATGNYTNLQKWNAGTTKWELVGTISTVVQKGNFMELSITRALLGMPTKLKVHMTMLIEKPSPDGWTYAGVPSTSFTDGPPPASSTFTKYYEFDLTDLSKAPNTYAPK